ncbi:MAG: CGGC domain-containing protein [Intestinimonas sp.]
MRLQSLSCRKAAETCGGVDCLGFFHRRERSFPAAGTGDAPGRLCHVQRVRVRPASDEAFQKKLDKLSGAGVEEVHVAACVTGEKRACPRKEAILTALSARGLRVCLLEERA